MEGAAVVFSPLIVSQKDQVAAIAGQPHDAEAAFVKFGPGRARPPRRL